MPSETPQWRAQWLLWSFVPTELALDRNQKAKVWRELRSRDHGPAFKRQRAILLGVCLGFSILVPVFAMNNWPRALGVLITLVALFPLEGLWIGRILQSPIASVVRDLGYTSSADEAPPSLSAEPPAKPFQG